MRAAMGPWLELDCWRARTAVRVQDLLVSRSNLSVRADVRTSPRGVGSYYLGEIFMAELAKMARSYPTRHGASTRFHLGGVIINQVQRMLNAF